MQNDFKRVTIWLQEERKLFCVKSFSSCYPWISGAHRSSSGCSPSQLLVRTAQAVSSLRVQKSSLSFGGGLFCALKNWKFPLTAGGHYANIMDVTCHGEVSERFKELVLKTSDSQEPWVRIPLSPPPFSPTTESLAERSTCRSTQVAIRGSPAKGVDRETGARVRIPPSAPSRSKLCIACSDLFYKSERTHAA